MTDHSEYVAENRAHWEEAARHHPRTDAYDVESFLAGETTLTPIERAELPDVAGDRLCHLQCHFGLDTLSWARAGAQVTGIDFASDAIETARELAAEADLADRAQFHTCEVTDAPDVVEGRFDTVVTTFGVLDWLPDLSAWADAVRRLLRPDGRFYLAEFHPICSLLPMGPDGFDGGPVTLDGSYGAGPEPETYDESGTYADPAFDNDHTRTHFWPHSMGQLLTALADADLGVEFVHEHQHTPWEAFSDMRERSDGCFEFPDCDLPLVVSLAARPA